MSPKRSPGSWSDEYESSRCRCAASTRWAGLHTASNLPAYPVGAQVFCFTREQQSAVTAGVRPEHQPPRGRVQLRNACAGGGRCSVGLPTEVAVAQDERRMAAAGAAGEAPTNLTVFGAALPAFAGARSRICRPSSTATMFGCGSTSGFVVGGPSTVLTRREGAAVAEVVSYVFRAVRGRPVRVSVAHRLGTRRPASRWDRDPGVPRPA